jgi:hypothetical protein
MAGNGIDNNIGRDKIPVADILAMNVVEPLGDAKCYFDALCVDWSVVSQIVLKVWARCVF